jgi:capsular polysaccharide biosynthesis protein
VAGLVLGGIAGAVLALGGSDTYQARAVLSLGQPFSPNGGSPVNGLINNPRTVGEIIRSESALEVAARRAGVSPSALRGHVSNGTITSQAKANAQPLVTIQVTGSKPRRVEEAANALTEIVIERISGDYVEQKITSFERQLSTLKTQIASVNRRITALNASLRNTNRSDVDQLVLVNLLDNAEARLGGLLQAQTLASQQLALAENIEKPRVVASAAAAKSSPRSRRNSILVGALIGLILGAIAAIVVDARAARR